MDVDQVRSFNRTVTERIGALRDSYLSSDRPLGADRVLWEIGDGTDLRALRNRLDLDSRTPVAPSARSWTAGATSWRDRCWPP